MNMPLPEDPMPTRQIASVPTTETGTTAGADAHSRRPSAHPLTQLPQSGNTQFSGNDSTEAMVSVLELGLISKHFGPRRLLNGLSLHLREHQVLAVCGASGCGKTTLLRIISGLSSFEAGQIRIGQTSIAAGTPYPLNLYGRIGFVFQDHNLFPHMTALANVTLALRRVKLLPVREAFERGMFELERMGVATLADRYPST